jgi:hypothetical protein
MITPKFSDYDLDCIAKLATFILENRLWKKMVLTPTLWFYTQTGYKLKKDPQIVCKKTGYYLKKVLGKTYKETQDKLRIRQNSKENLEHTAKYHDWLNNSKDMLKNSLPKK